MEEEEVVEVGVEATEEVIIEVEAEEVECKIKEIDKRVN